MQLAEWVHLKDLKSGAIFLNQEGTEAYSAVGLTQLPSAIIGDRGFVCVQGSGRPAARMQA
jgi:hypothetical protein